MHNTMAQAALLVMLVIVVIYVITKVLPLKLFWYHITGRAQFFHEMNQLRRENESYEFALESYRKRDEAKDRQLKELAILVQANRVVKRRLELEVGAARQASDEAQRNAQAYYAMLRSVARWDKQAEEWVPKSNPMTNRSNTLGLSQDDIKSLISLVHPDKHGGKESAHRMTQKLLEMRKK